MARKNTLEQKSARRLRKQLTAYSVAAGAALALANPADAALIYSGIVNHTLNVGSGPYSIDLDGDSTNDFAFSALGTASSGAVSVYGTGVGAYVRLQSTAATLVKNFPNSNSVNLGNPASWGYLHFATTFYWGFPMGGGPFDGSHGFIGIQFDIGGNQHLGWIEYEGNNNSASGTIVSWAYEQNPVPIPGTFGLGLLAMGAAGMARLRQRKKEAKETA